MKNNKGRTSTIVIIITALLLVSSTAIGFFMYQKENQMRKSLEGQLDDNKLQLEKFSADLRESRKQVTLLQDKNKEADIKINNLMDEMELNEGLRNELKKENNALKEGIEAAKKEKEALKVQLEIKAKSLQENQELLKAALNKGRDLYATMQTPEYNSSLASDKLLEVPAPAQRNMELEKIIIGDQKDKGRILSVDKESEFVICNLGSFQGVRIGDFLSVYRQDEYLGDLKISRVQDEMSAADFVAPLSSGQVRKNDLVVPK